MVGQNFLSDWGRFLKVFVMLKSTKFIIDMAMRMNLQYEER